MALQLTYVRALECYALRALQLWNQFLPSISRVNSFVNKNVITKILSYSNKLFTTSNPLEVASMNQLNIPS